MTSLTWSFDGSTSLLRSGLDAERVARFEALAREPEPLPLVFTEAEVQLARTTTDPARSLTAAFCCKEALRKALTAPYDWRDCQLLHPATQTPHPLVLSPQLARSHCVDAALAACLSPLDADELVMAVYLLRASGVAGQTPHTDPGGRSSK